MNSNVRSSIKKHLARMERAIEESLNLMKDDIKQENALMRMNLEFAMADMAYVRIERVHEEFYTMAKIERSVNCGEQEAVTNYSRTNVRSRAARSKTVESLSRSNKTSQNKYCSNPGNSMKITKEQSSSFFEFELDKRVAEIDSKLRSLESMLQPERFSQKSYCYKPGNSKKVTTNKPSISDSGIIRPEVPLTGSISSSVDSLQGHNSTAEIVNDESNVNAKSEAIVTSWCIENVDEKVGPSIQKEVKTGNEVSFDDFVDDSFDDSFSIWSDISDEFE